MPDIAETVSALGGMAQKQQLVARGARDLDLTLAVRRGEVQRARNGWYSTLSTSDPRFRAVRVGGRLTGISAIAALGGWVLGPTKLHVSVPTNSARLRSQWNRRRARDRWSMTDVEVHWDPADLSDRGTAMLVGLADALIQVALDESFEDAVAAFDWALHTGRIDDFDFEAILLSLPRHLQRLREWVDRECESLPESLARTRLRMAGHAVASQVPVGENERIDLVVDEAVAMEVDGEEFHVARFLQDRDKDLSITLDGRHAIRPAAVHIFNDWARVERAVEVALEARGLPSFGNSGLAAASARGIGTNQPSPKRSRRVSPEFPIVHAGAPLRGGARFVPRWRE